MARNKPVEKSDVQNIKMLLSKNVEIKDICNITGWSYTTVTKVKDGFYDYCMNSSDCKTDLMAAIEVVSQRADEIQNDMAELKELLDMKLDKKYVADNFNWILSGLESLDKKMEMLLAKIDKPSEVETSKNSCEGIFPPEQCSRWSEILSRVKKIDNVAYYHLKKSTAVYDGVTLTIQCNEDAKKYLDRNAGSVKTIKNNAQLVLNMPVACKWRVEK